MGVFMALPEQKKKLLKAKIAVALHDELGRVPKEEEIEQVFLKAGSCTRQCWDCITSGRNRRKTGSWQSSNARKYLC